MPILGGHVVKVAVPVAAVEVLVIPVDHEVRPVTVLVLAEREGLPATPLLVNPS